MNPDAANAGWFSASFPQNGASPSGHWLAAFHWGNDQRSRAVFVNDRQGSREFENEGPGNLSPRLYRNGYGPDASRAISVQVESPDPTICVLTQWPRAWPASLSAP